MLNKVAGAERSGDPLANVIAITPELIKRLSANEIRDVAEASPELQEQLDQYTYYVGVGDVLNITVWDHPELTIPAGQFRSAGETGNVVHPDGSIFYPYVGQVHVAGKAVSDIRELITSALSQFIESPQIEVSVAAYRSQRVFVSGAVAAPASVPITNVPLTLLDALNAVGGLAENADLRSVVLTTTAPNADSKELLDLYALYQLGDMSHNRLLTANDIIHVPRNDELKVFVMGDVKDAGTQRIDRSGLTLAEALNNVGGINETTADASGIFVLRAGETEEGYVDIYQLDASMAGMLILSTQFQLQPLDVVYVTSAPIARWNRVLSQLTSSIRVVYELDRINNP